MHLNTRTLRLAMISLVAVVSCSKPSQRAISLPLDNRTQEHAVFGIYVYDRGGVSDKSDPATGQRLPTTIVNPTWPFGLVVAGWADGRVAWSVSTKPEYGEVAWSTVNAELVGKTCERIASTIDGPLGDSTPPFVEIDMPEAHLFAVEGGRVHSIWCSLSSTKPGAACDPRLVSFLRKWTACRDLAMDLVPHVPGERSSAWVGFDHLSR
jgi:hypothetical protein